MFHAAGQAGDAPVSAIDPDAFGAVHDPKVIGAYLLHKHTAGEPLDHFAVFSSIASLLPAGGQAHAAAGNAFLDALAHHRRSAGLPALSVNWGPCADAAITVTEGLIDRLLGEDRAQVAVAAVDWRAFAARSAVVPRLLAGLIEDAGASGRGEPAAVDIWTDETCFPLSRNQQALWIVNQLDPDTVPYHLGDAVEIHARLDPELVFAAVRILIRRHPMLRARIAVRDGRPVHRIARDVTADVKLIDVRGWTWADLHAALVASTAGRSTSSANRCSGSGCCSAGTAGSSCCRWSTASSRTRPRPPCSSTSCSRCTTRFAAASIRCCRPCPRVISTS